MTVSNIVRRFGVLIIIVVIGIAVFVFRDRLSGGASDLKVGDCFDVPAQTTSIKDVQHHPCTEAHTGEVFATVKHPAAKDAPVPTTTELREFLTTGCGSQFTVYTGRSTETEAELDFGAFYPLDKDWKDGDRDITCYLYRVDEGPMTSSMKKAS